MEDVGRASVKMTDDEALMWRILDASWRYRLDGLPSPTSELMRNLFEVSRLQFDRAVLLGKALHHLRQSGRGVEPELVSFGAVVHWLRADAEQYPSASTFVWKLFLDGKSWETVHTIDTLNGGDIAWRRDYVPLEAVAKELDT
jgi:hypothetical protein